MNMFESYSEGSKRLVYVLMLASHIIIGYFLSKIASDYMKLFLMRGPSFPYRNIILDCCHPFLFAFLLCPPHEGLFYKKIKIMVFGKYKS